jgi:hypothetical protein
LIHNQFESPDNEIEQDESQPMILEIEDEKKKIIQKETIHTGSVSCFLSDIIFSEEYE